MSRCKDWRQLPSAPSSPASTGIVSYWCDQSGILNFVDSLGVNRVANTFYPTVAATLDVTNTGTALFPNNLGAYATGKVYGTTGTNVLPFILGSPNFWIQALGPSGQALRIPAYYAS